METWDNFEHTRDISILQDRYKHFTTLESNSCGPDCILFAGIYSGAIIRQHDAISFNALLKLNGPQLRFRLILTAHWGLLSLQNRNKARNAFADSIHESLKQRNIAHSSRETDVQDLIGYSFAGIPSYSYTTSKGYICCDRIMKINPESRSTTITDILITCRDDATLEQVINDSFSRSKVPNSRIRHTCTNKGCKGNLKVVYVVLDRLPPILIISIMNNNLTIERAKVAKVFSRLKVKFRGKKNARVKEYKIEGVILLRTIAAQRNHFFCRWNGISPYKNRVIEFDSLVKDEPYPVPSWEDNIAQDTIIRILFYRVV